MTTILLLLAIGLGAGVLSGMFGIGGGIIVVPALVFLLKMSLPQASGTSLASLVLPLGAAVGVYKYYKAGHQLDLTHAVLIAVGMMAGAFLGAQIATSVDALVMRRAFAILLAVVAVQMWVK
ncbi:MAG: TSUP family transporter [Gemmatimonadota bacterium]